jgi:hypothetical protein
MGAIVSLSQRFARAYTALFGSAPATLTTNPERPIGSPGTRTRDTLGRKRKRGNGRIQPPSIDKSRWLRKDIEDAEDEANSGNLRHLAQIGEWVRADLTVGGLLANRCSVPRLPRIWRGNQEAREWLEGSGKAPGVFDAIFPPAELEELAIDHLVDGVGVGVFIRPRRCKYVKLVRLDPQWLQFRIHENRWVYQGYNRLYDVEPGNGTWFLHTNGEVDPWRRGIGADLGRDQCSEDTAGMHRDAFIAKYGNPFVVATAPQGQADTQKFTFWRSLLTWTMGFAGVTPGHKVELLQPKAEGREVFNDAEQKAERRAMMRIAGQIVTSTGTVGFVNAEIFAQIASHLVARTGQDLSTSLNEQCIGQIVSMGIEDGWIEDDAPLLLGYDTTPPQARKAEAEAIEAAMKAFVSQWEAADKASDPSLRPSVEEYRARFRLPVATDQLAAANAAIRTLTAEQRQQLFMQMRAENDNAPIEINTAPKDIEEPEEPGYSEKLAASMTARGDVACPCDRHEERFCPRCRVIRRYEAPEDPTQPYRAVWHAVMRKAAA